MNHRRADVRAAVFQRQRSQGHLRAVTVTVGIVLNVGGHRVLLLVLAMPLGIIPFKVAGASTTGMSYCS